ncbi:MAG: choice-of-anchor Q domain-containing protein [Chloroflexota bacterium]
MRFHDRLLGSLALACAALLLTTVNADAAAFNVTKLTDSADGACNTDCSLREAVIAANAAGGANTIRLTLPGTYQLTIPGGLEDASATGDLDVLSDVTLVNDSGVPVTIRQTVADRVFDVSLGGALRASKLSITGGKLTGQAGGGIRSDGLVVLVDATVADNVVTVSWGGGIYNAGTLNLDRVTLSGNTANFGGALSSSNALTVTNSTLSGNVAIAAGGGMYLSGLATVTNATIARNSATYGGGLFIESGTVVMRNSIVALPGPWQGGGCWGAPLDASSTNNVQDAYFGALFSYCGPGFSVDKPVVLGDLADNGGFTSTHLPFGVGSGVDEASVPLCPAVDQRGVARPFHGVCDVGAVEANYTDVVVSLADVPSTVGQGGVVTHTVTVKNGGPLDATGVMLTVSATAALTSPVLACERGQRGSCSVSGPGLGALVSVPAGGTVRLRLTGTVATNSVGQLTVTATVSAAAGLSDPVIGNNASSRTDLVSLLSRGGPNPGPTGTAAPLERPDGPTGSATPGRRPPAR